MCLGSILLMSSCSSDDKMEGPDQVDSVGLTVQLKLNTGLLLTRSDDKDHKPIDGTAAESFINILTNDYQVYILDGENDKIISKFEPSSVVRTDNGTYRLLGTFYNEEGLKKVRFMALSNWTTDFTTGNYPEMPAEGDFSIDDLYSNNTDYNFIYPVDVLPGAETWIPDNKNSGIPMVGLSDPLSIPESGTSVPGQTPWIEVSSIPMLRALAKITVNDKTNDDEVEIVSVKIKNYNTDGRFIPDGTVDENKNWNQNAIQVKVPTLTGKPTKGGELNFVTPDKGKSYLAYVPEIDNSSSQATGECYLEVTTKLMGSFEKNHKIHLGKYEEGAYIPGSFMDILRNHWYNFDITSVSANGINLTVIVVDDWDVIHNMELE